ncbi:hypothetical protein K440DRAFT_641826 [Wilcoxina mikolae CBS 423.85]|nr:hypothetical protein K440DRAFT_641826 [Wilcoxina mikolae CBS 423.85]
MRTDNSCSVSRFLNDDEEYHSEDKGNYEIDCNGDADEDGYEEYKEDLIRSLECHLEQARKRATITKMTGSAMVIPAQKLYILSQELTLILTKGASQGDSQEASQDDLAPCNTNKDWRKWNEGLPDDTQGLY